MKSKYTVLDIARRVAFIEVRAYIVWSRRGGGASTPEQMRNDWLVAEYEIDREYVFK